MAGSTPQSSQLLVFSFLLCENRIWEGYVHYVKHRVRALEQVGTVVLYMLLISMESVPWAILRHSTAHCPLSPPTAV